MIIKTTKLAATGTLGERVMARETGGYGRSTTMAWDYAIDDLSNHLAVASVIANASVKYESYWRRGYYFITE